MTILLALFFLLIVGLMVAGGARTFSVIRRASDRMAEAGHLLGFEFEVDPHIHLYPKITGESDGLLVQIYVAYPNTDDPSVFYEVRYPMDGAPAFVIKTRSRFNSPIRNSNEMPEFTLGDPTFDKAVRIRATDRAAVSRILTPARQTAVASLIEHWKKIEVTHESLLVQSGDAVPKDPKEIVFNVDQLVAIAKLLKAPPPNLSDADL